MKEPCINCLCLAACKGKGLSGLVAMCSLIQSYLDTLQDDGKNKVLEFIALDRTYKLDTNNFIHRWTRTR
jgi:hypothetical protein